MDIAQKQNLNQQMRQEQTMTHQQIQALELLFMPATELEGFINAEVEKNPVLDNDLSLTEDVAQFDQCPSTDSDQWLENILKIDDDKRYIKSYNQNISGSGNDLSEKYDYFLNSVEYQMSLDESLTSQLNYFNLTPEVFENCTQIIAALDDDGYLRSHIADLAMVTMIEVSKLEEALSIVQKLEPVGVGARDLRERLLLQLETQGEKKSLCYQLVDQYMDKLGSNQLPFIARKLKISMYELADVIDEIKNLQPVLRVSEQKIDEYVKPEVFVEEDELGNHNVRLNNEMLPNLYVSNQYRQLLMQEDVSKETKNYIKEKLNSGMFLINSIIQRQQTIKKIVKAMVEFQSEYFIHGEDRMRPMTMLQIADKIGVHETTVSRTVSGKYLQGPHGLIALRAFFSTGYVDGNGMSVSKNVVKEIIKNLIAKEDARKPLSDSKISEMLQENGYNVARRTVAKYRISMNISQSKLRRQYV
ncbi:RNA polymerase factor sigma-54 [Lentisphaerota bacterium WC36G]|nr:RNA polymerase factor sigma-54 [Lentisphaerae bacterium WC36]